MLKLISIDPGKFKCGLVLAEINEKKVYKAIILKSELLEDYVRNLNYVEDISKIIIGNGTTSREIIEKLGFLKKEIITFEEKILLIELKQDISNFFQLAVCSFNPKGDFILNKNLDAISALIILEDYCKMSLL